MQSSKEQVIAAIRDVAARAGKPYLPYKVFCTMSGLSMGQVHRHFDTWTQAFSEAGVTCGTNGPENIVPNFSKGREHALQQMKKAAARLGTQTLSQRQFNGQNLEVKAITVSRLFSGWKNALQVAGLDQDPMLKDPVSEGALHDEFLRVVLELGRVPSLMQLTRRSAHCDHTFTKRDSGYKGFKKRAIRDILERQSVADTQTRTLLSQHLDQIAADNPEQEPSIVPHHRGRHLGFRAFAFAPTYENEVVSLFSCVADELGFEIVCQRPAFPDCEARRMTDRQRGRFQKCMIEFEYKSREYVTHKHPLNGCDLIVCWEHNWPDCPVEVLELKEKIRSLDGWK